MPKRVRRRFQGKRLGDYLMQCDLSGQIFWASEMREMWDGKWVAKIYWEERHPQDFVRGGHDDTSVPVARPESTEVYRCEPIYDPLDEIFEQEPMIYLACGDT